MPPLLSADAVDGLKDYLHEQIRRCEFLYGYKETENYRALAAAIANSSSIDDFKHAVKTLHRELTTGAGGYLNENKVSPHHINRLIPDFQTALHDALKASRSERDTNRPRSTLTAGERRTARAVYLQNRLFHGTSRASVRSIRKHGLTANEKVPGAAASVFARSSLRPEVLENAKNYNYLTPEKQAAKAYASMAKGDDAPGLVRFIVAHDEFSLVPDPDSEEGDGSLRTDAAIPASRVLGSKRSPGSASASASAFRAALARAGIDVAQSRAAEMLQEVQSDSESDFDAEIIDIDIEEDRASRTGKSPAARPAGDVAHDVLNAAMAAEPRITGHLQEAASRYGGELSGLERRFKTAGALAKKLEHRLPQEINDALRYTMVFEPDRLAEGVQSVLRTFTQSGYANLLVQNNFRTGVPYIGINVILRSPENQVFEVQFHTRESLALREQNHDLYQIYKVTPAGDPDRQVLMRRMLDNASQVYIAPAVQQALQRAFGNDDEAITQAP
ncbi:hypothetical protein NCCP691_22910 [Noviherbaspirillum aridicola]|uniref:RelA/SpoT domain-containing protein n=2 Tax=Noviherbaspirillum aridicola TaxID=2849687 RepID=A0ABQ4Q5F5_9BURK|nr:hypothetical protein NCCP691_22910 [Noviherbaspirillum aridicola]